jgi:hypothetical protein
MEEIWSEYQVIVGIENEHGDEYPVIESMLLEAADVAENYVWADEEQTILKKKDVQL